MGFFDLIDTVKKATGTSDKPQVTEPTRLARLGVCRKCPNYFSPLDQCLLCGCVLSQKTKYVEERCKIKKW